MSTIEAPGDAKEGDFMTEAENETSYEPFFEIGKDDVVVLDLDRTLIKSGHVAADFFDAVKASDSSRKDEVQGLYDDGMDRSNFQYIKELGQLLGVEFSNEKLEHFAHDIVWSKTDEEFAKLVQEYTVDGAIDIIRFAKEHSGGFFLKTAGDTKTQYFKIKILENILYRLDILKRSGDEPGAELLPYIITDPDHNKVELLDSARSGPQFSLAHLQPKGRKSHLTHELLDNRPTRIIILDDKAKNLKDEVVDLRTLQGRATQTSQSDGATVVALHVKANGDPSMPGIDLRDLVAVLRPEYDEAV